MNVYDAQRMADLLAPQGYRETPSIEDADLVILNTCHIRERRDGEDLLRTRQDPVLKQERAAAGHATTLVVAGCVAQAEGAEILRRAKAVDVVVGPQSYHRLPELLGAGRAGRPIDTDFELDDKFARLPAPAAPDRRAGRAPS